MAYMNNSSALSLVGPPSWKPYNVREMLPRQIDVGDRHRPLNMDKVRELAQSFLDHSQKQPIGVREKKQPTGNYRFELLYGLHRLEAVRLLEREGKEVQPMVWAIIYPEDYPDIAAQMDEIVENLHRLDLTPSEKSSHQSAYAGFLKKAHKVQAANKIKAGRPKLGDAKLSEPHAAVHLSNNLPTVTEKIASDLGVDKGTVQRRHAIALKLAAREGMVPETIIDVNGKELPPTIENMEADDLIKIGQAASIAASKKIEKAKETGKNEKLVDAIQPQKPGLKNIRIDILHLPASFEKVIRRELELGTIAMKDVEQCSDMLLKLLNDVSLCHNK